LIRVAARFFRAVHRAVGVLEQRLGRVAVVRKERDADARRHVELVPFDRHRVRDRVEQLLGDPRRVVGRLEIAEEDREFVAAHAGDGVAVAQHRAQSRGDGAEKLVAEAVAEGVVDVLEAV
jgi:hypothetical protein